MWISLLIKFGSKTIKQNTAKNKFIRYLCFIAADFIHICHHCLKMSSFSLEKNRFRGSIDLTCWQSTYKPLRLRFLTALNTSSWKDLWSKDDRSHFKYYSSFQISWTSSDVFRIEENFIHELSAMFTCRDGKVGVLSSQATEMLYSPRSAVNITSY